MQEDRDELADRESSQSSVTPFDFYMSPRIATAMLPQLRFRYVALRTLSAMFRHYDTDGIAKLLKYDSDLWLPTENPFVEIHRATGPDDPLSLEYHVRRGVIEFIPEVTTIFDADRSATILVDLDPKSMQIGLADLLFAASLVTLALGPNSQFDGGGRVRGVKYRYSGNRSIHVILKLDKLYPVNELRSAVRAALEPLVRSYPTHLSLDNMPIGSYIYLDCNAIARGRAVRALYSLHHKTGLACVPVPTLETFDIRQADPEFVLRNPLVDEAFQ